MAAPQQAFFMAGTTTPYAATIRAAGYTRLGSTPCAIQFRSDGSVWVKDQSSGGLYSFRYNWRTGAGDGSNYEIRNTLNVSSPDSFTSGTMATWQALSTTREWTRASANWQDRIAIGDFEIRNASTLVVLALNTISLECEYGTGTPP